MAHEDNQTMYDMNRATGVVVMLLGMALQWALLHAITFSGTLFGTGEEPTSDSSWVVNSLFTFLVFLACFVHSLRRDSLVTSRRALFTLGCVLVVGSVVFVAVNLTTDSPALVYLSNALIACGTTPLIVMWGEVYKFLNPKGEQLLVTLGAIILSVMVYLTLTCLPTSLVAIVFVALAAGTATCLAFATARLSDTPDLRRPKAPAPARRSPALLFVCIVVFSVPYSYLRTSEQVQQALGSEGWTTVLAVAIVIMVAVALAELLAENHGLLLEPTLVLLLLTAAMIVHVVSDAFWPLLTPCLLYAGYYLFLAMVYLALGPIVAMTDINPVRLFSEAMMANVGGLLLGSLLAEIGSLMGEPSATIMVLAITYIILFLGCILLYGRSYSIFRVNSFDEDEYSFEFIAPYPSASTSAPAEPATPVTADMTAAGKTPSAYLEAIETRCGVAAQVGGLSTREREVLVELMRGKTIATIAGDLVLSENTIKAHTKSIYRKLDVHTREELQGRVEGILADQEPENASAR